MDSFRDQNVLWEEYQKADHDLRIRSTRIGCVLVIVLVAAGSSLDHFQYPHLFWSILPARMLCNLVVGLVLVLCYTTLGRRFAQLLSLVWHMPATLVICWMIYISEGSVSPFYAGLNLVIIAFCLFMPYTLLEALGQCIFVVLAYLTVCLLHEGTPLNIDLLSNNLTFILMTSVFGVAACHFNHRRRISDFKLRHELDQRNQQLMELDRLKSQFFANVSHELRTPLTLILAPLEGILQGETPLPNTVREALTLVKKNSDRLLRLINDLLEIVRLEEGKLKLECKRLQINEFVRGMVDSVRELAAQSGLEIEVSTAEGEPLEVLGDEGRLEKVLLNLLINAIKFTPSGGKIVVRGWREDTSVKVAVEDTGIGISEQELPFIFDRFRQVDGELNPQSKGLGLGLALSRELIEEHGGQLTATSQPGKGAAFLITLPVTHAEISSPVGATVETADERDPLSEMFRSANRAIAAVDPRDFDLDEAGCGDTRILVVDDEPDMRRFLVSTLSEEYIVMQAADGESGLETAREKQPDLLVLDLMLPGISGLDVCRRLRSDERTRNVKILMLTARIDENPKIEALKHGADDFLTKPFSTVEVKTRIRNLLKSARLQNDLRNRNEELSETLARLRATESQLIQSEKMNALGGLAAGLLHEINNPLNYAMLALELAKRTSASTEEDLADAMNDIEEGMKRICDIVSDLRDFAYPEQADKHEEFDIRGAIETALRFTAHELGGMSVELDGLKHDRAIGSRTQITQVFINMLTNAARAVETVGDRPAQIRISSERERERLCVCVGDSGVGIDGKQISRVFDPFFTTREVGQGVGLGLSVCDTIIRNHGGTISVKSDRGNWTEFTFDLPLSKNEN